MYARAYCRLKVRTSSEITAQNTRKTTLRRKKVNRLVMLPNNDATQDLRPLLDYQSQRLLDEIQLTSSGLGDMPY